MPDSPLPVPPPFGEVRAVAPGVLWLRLPLPFALDHVNVWLLEDGDGWTVVDAGLGGEHTKALWREVFRGALGGRPVRRVIASHFHPDHIGLAGWLVEAFDAEFLCTRLEWLLAQWLSIAPHERSWPVQEAFYTAAGVPADKVASIGARGNLFARSVSPIPQRFTAIADGDVLRIGGREWRVMTGGGHAPEHASLHCPELGLLIAQDQVLPRISPNVAVWANEPAGDPLCAFLAALDRFGGLPETTLVLPGHDAPFATLRQRTAALARHHADRLAEVAEDCREPRTAMDVTLALFRRPLDDHQLIFAVGEALAHLNRLIRAGEIAAEPGADGITRYRRR
ncbi:MAG TPA: MBL fold metallo-hydrolase [Alphaproteobacteria bacterium]|nr:MBL fold metallo-hydrolase [Alphaproteobacteria bacterium]